MEDLEKAIQRLQEIEKLFGLLGVLIVIIIILTAYLLFNWLNKSIEKMAEEASEKSLSKFQHTLDKRLETQVKLLFRNEEIRNSVTSHLAIKSIETKLEIWTETYQIFFEYQEILNLDNALSNDKLSELDDKLHKKREKIFINSVYLGGYLSFNLIVLCNNMRNAIRSQHRYNHLISINQDGSSNLLEKNRNSEKIQNILAEVIKWMNDNLIVDHNSKMWDFTFEQLKIINEQNSQNLEELNSVIKS